MSNLTKMDRNISLLPLLEQYITKNGAQPSESVSQIFRSAGLLERYERYQKGEELETLTAEAKAAEALRNINPKTETGQPATKKKTEK
jgi:hypothetical protein